MSTENIIPVEVKLHTVLQIHRWEYEMIFDRVKSSIESLAITALTPFELFEATIRYLTLGDKTSDLANSYGLEKRLMGTSIISVIKVLGTLGSEDLKINGKLWKKIERKFCVYENFPNCVGILGAMRFKAGLNDSILRKKTMTVYAVVDIDRRFILLETHAGSDKTFKSSLIYEKISNDQLHLPIFRPNSNVTGSKMFVADVNFPQLGNICVPYKKSFARGNGDLLNYNRKVKSLLRFSRDAFMGLDYQFHILKNLSSVNYTDVDDIIHACASIHNFKITHFGSSFKGFAKKLPSIKISKSGEFPVEINYSRVAMTYYFSRNAVGLSDIEHLF